VNGHQPLPDLVVRPIHADDRERILRLFARLSPESIYRRFFTLFPALPAPLLEHLVRVDHHDHEGLVALDGDEIVAVAGWDRTPQANQVELSILVEDAWQHRGLGKALMRALTAEIARQGFTAVTATVLSENVPARRLAISLARPTSVGMDGGVTHFTYRLAS